MAKHVLGKLNIQPAFSLHGAPNTSGLERVDDFGCLKGRERIEVLPHSAREHKVVLADGDESTSDQVARDSIEGYIIDCDMSTVGIEQAQKGQ